MVLASSVLPSSRMVDTASELMKALLSKYSLLDSQEQSEAQMAAVAAYLGWQVSAGKSDRGRRIWDYLYRLGSEYGSQSGN